MSLDSPMPNSPPATSTTAANGGCFPRRAMTMATAPSVDDSHLYMLKVYLFSFNPESADHRLTIDFHKRSTTEELIDKILDIRANSDRENFANCSRDDFELFDTMGTLDGRTYKERKMDATEYPVLVQTLWPKGAADAANDTNNNDPSIPRNRFVLKSKKRQSTDQSSLALAAASTIDTFLAKFLAQPQNREYADLCVLPELTEQTLLDNLRDRFNNGKIYTYIGPILVAVNPFNFFPIYNPKYSRLYCQSRRLGALPPHVFAIADVTYHNLIRQKENQVVVISGESGSGKTESTNFLLHQLTTLSQKGTQGHTIEQQILSAGPVLEAFGNAVTVQNNNSSRFGKFIKVNYRENGMVWGANVEIYLLEKSRIISQAVEERNYHVFYYLLEGANEEERTEHFLLEAKDYNYLNQNNYFACEALNERHEFERLKHAMAAVGFAAITQQKIFGVISTVLLLGNIEYTKMRPGYHSDESALIENAELIDVIARLLSIKAQQLTQALTMRRTVLKRDLVISKYGLAEAAQTRDAMAKCLYNALFHWIVLRINHSLVRKETSAASKNGLFIGILDIFGFEDVGAQWNSFEQLCINYANERLQAYFNQHIFQFEQEEYLKENISWTPIQYTDNTECVQMFQSKPYGLLRLVDEESQINNGTDQSMLEKLNTFLRSNEYYEVPHRREPAFIIAHYAGKVKYQIAGFREKNKDPMRHDVMNVLKSTKSAFVRELVAEDPVAVFRWALLRATFRAMFAFRQAGLRAKPRAGSVDRCALLSVSVADRPPEKLRRCSDSHLNAFLRGEIPASIVPDFCDTSVFDTIKERARKTPTRQQNERHSYLRSLQMLRGVVGKLISNKPSSVSRQFGESLTRLMNTLGQATPYFIRCIKSNNEKIPNFFDDNIILRQLRYTGMLETVRIRRAGYSVRIQYESFVNQYRILLPNGLASTKTDIQQFMLHNIPIITNNIQYGNTKIFMRDPEKLLLDDLLHRVIMEKILTLQRWIRARLEQKRYQKFRQGVIKMQALTRGVLTRTRLKQRNAAAICIQCWWRKVMAQKRYCCVRQTILRLQALIRGQAQRKRLEEMRASKENKVLQTSGLIGPITRLTKVTLPKLDWNDPDTLAAFASPDSFDSQDLVDDEMLLWKEEEDVEEEEEDEEEDDIFDGDLLLDIGHRQRRESSEVDLDASFVLENARLKLIRSEEEKLQQQQMHRRQSLIASATSAKFRMLRRAASTESDHFQQIGDEAPITPGKVVVASSLTKVAPKAKSSFLKATKQLKALLGGKIGARESGGGADDSGTLEGPSSSTRSSSKEASDKLAATAAVKQRCHNFKPTTRLYKGDKCALCNRLLNGLLVQGFKCFGCKLAFHKECANFALKIPCTSPLVSPAATQKTLESSRKPWEKISLRSPRSSLPSSSPSAASYGGRVSGTFSAITSFNLTKTKQQTDPTALLIESTDDLREFSVFIFKKQSALGQLNKRETVVDAIFKRALREFHMELIGMEAILQEGRATLKYHDLIRTFEGLLTKQCNEEHVTFPTTLGVNAFRGFLNEFMHHRRKSSSRKSSNLMKTVRKKRRRSDITLHNGHHFNLDYVHIPTYCEICNVFMWHAERIFICISCRLSCHKKCHSKVAYVCPKAALKDTQQATSSRFFGADLANLFADDEVPVTLNKLLTCIEVRGLFVEGIYRKSGQMALIKNIRKGIETAEDPETMSFDDLPVHVLTSLVKAFFRELSEPLITSELYENFVNISEIKETGERIRCLRAMIDILPKGNKCVLDRLMYHLARVAHQETVNRMSTSNLAVIFAPCIVRRSTPVHAQEQLLDVQKQAICVQTLIEDKLRQCQETLSQIVELETASEKVTENLRLIEEHRRVSGGSVGSGAPPPAEVKETASATAATAAAEALPSLPSSAALQSSLAAAAEHIETARQLFQEQLEFLDKEKAKLLQDLPPLAPVASSEDLSSEEEQQQKQKMEKEAAAAKAGKRKSTLVSSGGRGGSLSGASQEEYAIDLNAPPVLFQLPQLVKGRAHKCSAMRAPSAAFLAAWRHRAAATAMQYEDGENEHEDQLHAKQQQQQ